MSRQEELPAVPAAPTQRQLPVSGEEPGQQSSRKAGAPEPFCHSQREIPGYGSWQPFPDGGWSVKAAGEPWIGQLA